MAQTSVERIVAEIQDLSPQERLRLIRTVVDTLITPGRAAESRRLIYGEFRGGRMSTEDDFKIAEWRPQGPGDEWPINTFSPHSIRSPRIGFRRSTHLGLPDELGGPSGEFECHRAARNARSANRRLCALPPISWRHHLLVDQGLQHHCRPPCNHPLVISA